MVEKNFCVRFVIIVFHNKTMKLELCLLISLSPELAFGRGVISAEMVTAGSAASLISQHSYGLPVVDYATSVALCSSVKLVTPKQCTFPMFKR